MSGHDPELRATETFQFRGWLADAAKSPEPQRSDSMVGYLRILTICPYLPQDECFTAVYGPNGARVFWKVQCSEPIELNLFVDLLTLTGSGNRPSIIPVLRSAMVSAFQSGEKWFVGDLTPLEGANYGWEVWKSKNLNKLKVRARDATEWLLRMPKRRHLVPPSLVAFIRSEIQGDDAAGANRSKGVRKKPRGVSYREQDRPLIEEMRRLLTAQPPQAKGPFDAALAVSGNAAGTGSAVSKAKRLVRLYSVCSETEQD
jgi:hypothetical protein